MLAKRTFFHLFAHRNIYNMFCNFVYAFKIWWWLQTICSIAVYECKLYCRFQPINNFIESISTIKWEIMAKIERMLSDYFSSSGYFVCVCVIQSKNTIYRYENVCTDSLLVFIFFMLLLLSSFLCVIMYARVIVDQSQPTVNTTGNV